MNTLRKDLIRTLIKSGGVQVRDVDAGEKPFLYSSGNYGPGYIDVKGRCTLVRWTEACATELAREVINAGAVPDVVTGNATGGMIASWEFGRQLSRLIGKDLPFFYLRGTRKVGGHEELVTGEKSLLREGMIATVGEELVNFAGTTSGATKYLRERHNLVIRHGTSFLNYDHDKNRDALRAVNIEPVHLFTLDQVLDLGTSEDLLDRVKVEKYRVFLEDTAAWMAARGLKRQEAA